MPDPFILQLHIDPSRQGSYFTLPFQVPEGIESLSVRYSYVRRASLDQPLPGGIFTARPEMNIVDIGLIAPDGSQVGASGSDKLEVTVSDTFSTPGYRPVPILPGEWGILVGAYKIQPEGLDVRYEVTLQPKSLRLLRGDLHAHTLASDGVHTPEELALKALRHGLDFLAITDHNQQVSADALPRVPGVTMLPGVEWTHYQGHANFIGVDRPYDEPFAAHTPHQALAIFQSARARGAFITINHPFDVNCGFHFDMTAFPCDCLEVWNGPMREYNLKAVGYWQKLLESGKKVPICGGSDYHRDTPFIFLGGPTTCVYALSNGASDILNALRAGHSFITFAPGGPTLHLSAGDQGAIMGDSVPWAAARELRIRAEALLAGDVLRVVTAASADAVFKALQDGDLALTFPVESPGFARVEVLRAFLPGLPMLPAALSNPIYFDGA